MITCMIKSLFYYILFRLFSYLTGLFRLFIFQTLCCGTTEEAEWMFWDLVSILDLWLSCQTTVVVSQTLPA